ncbi:Glycogen biosynthesis protein GlgD [Caprobacter fermentans]|uniref:Glycogen biosynthesis protein GlgD n=1 Tax=Caproicibacter fermentans TaxID=2576756 RepID=A0A6N8HZN0_9FIRM|nr:glucose-1-phosphate adenylyltransferase subunit GlgD [Caproicibacter fermentans]MVB11276.1 Glycogen biosynthesis protein GlgD [Caproicibacter fermentans]OCN00134.1 glucose-1-phosphate adenylyltransferase subunit GlgD [Clostridium sp. W14A]
MRGNNVLGLIFSNTHEEKLRDLTEIRTMGSVPFGGRYRLIDFPLSNMVNSGISKVGVVTKSNYQSLMDHLGSGKAWDLSRKREGLYILPPFGDTRLVNNRVESLASIKRFLTNSKEDLVLITDSDVVCNIDYSDVVSSHIGKNSDVTLVCRFGPLPRKLVEPLVLTTDPDGRVIDLLIDPRTDGECCYGIGMILLRRELLIRLVDDCVSRNLYSFKRDLLQRNLSSLRMYSYEFSGYARIISSPVSYFAANMELMQPNVRAQLFNPNRPVYTKVRDDMPARYGLGSEVSNSLVADGCVIDGEVRNSVLFRGVRVGKGAVVENCVVLQDGQIRPGCKMKYVITDKDVLIQSDRSLLGFESYPIFISKGSVV